MELTHKKILQNMLYYSVLALTIIASIFFMVTLAMRDTMMYARVIFYIWTGVLVATLIFDIVCTVMHKNKFIVGLILFVLAMCWIVMAIVIYFNLSTGAMLVAANMGLFNRLVVFSFILTVMAITTFIIGEFLTQSFERR